MQVRLFDAMDRAAIKLLEILDDPKDEAGKSKYDIGTQMRAFTQAQDWLTKRERARPKDIEVADDEGIAMLRQLIADPAEMVDHILADPTCVAELKARDWLPPLAKKTGRPDQAAALARTRYKARQGDTEPEDDAEDSSELIAALGIDP